jgi:membrane protease YdiL (CAAX protease family)
MHPEPTNVPQPRPVPWSGAELLAIAFLVVFFWPAAVNEALHVTGVYRSFYGEERAALVRDESAPKELRQQAANRLSLWVRVIAFPFQAATILLLPYAVSGTRPAQLGLTRRRLGRNLLAGAVVAVVLTPAVLSLNYSVEHFYQVDLGGKTQEHPLTQAAREGLTAAEWFLLIFGATVAAPVLEELEFRGLLQPWFAARRGGGWAAMGIAFLWAAATCWGGARAALPLGPGPFLDAAAPALFVLALIPIFLLVVWRSRTPAGPALFGTAALFAAIHSGAWPSPVALLPLGLGLGALAWRTRSLAGPILVHSLFNSVSVVGLLLSPRS